MPEKPFVWFEVMFSNNLANDLLPSIIFCANWSDSLGLSSRNLFVWVRGRRCFNSTGLGYGLHRSWIDECKAVERAWKRKVLSHLSHRFSGERKIIIIGEIFSGWCKGWWGESGYEDKNSHQPLAKKTHLYLHMCNKHLKTGLQKSSIKIKVQRMLDKCSSEPF